MLLHTPCYGWVSNKMAGEYPVLQGAWWALRNTMQTLVVIGNNLSGLVSVGINESILASDHWHQQKKNHSHSCLPSTAYQQLKWNGTNNRTGRKVT